MDQGSSRSRRSERRSADPFGNLAIPLTAPKRTAPQQTSSVNLFQSVGELTCFGPSCFNEKVEHREQRFKTFRILSVPDLKQFSMVGKRVLDEFDHFRNRQGLVLKASRRTGANRLCGQEKGASRV